MDDTFMVAAILIRKKLPFLQYVDFIFVKKCKKEDRKWKMGRNLGNYVMSTIFGSPSPRNGPPS